MTREQVWRKEAWGRKTLGGEIHTSLENVCFPATGWRSNLCCCQVWRGSLSPGKSSNAWAHRESHVCMGHQGSTWTDALLERPPSTEPSMPAGCELGGSVDDQPRGPPGPTWCGKGAGEAAICPLWGAAHVLLGSPAASAGIESYGQVLQKFVSMGHLTLRKQQGLGNKEKVHSLETWWRKEPD